MKKIIHSHILYIIIYPLFLITTNNVNFHNFEMPVCFHCIAYDGIYVYFDEVFLKLFLIPPDTPGRILNEMLT